MSVNFLLGAVSQLFWGAQAANDTVINWNPEPKTCGTCTATLALCVWTALHLNIEPAQSSKFKSTTASRFMTKLMWAAIALIVSARSSFRCTSSILAGVRVLQLCKRKWTAARSQVWPTIPHTRPENQHKESFLQLDGGVEMNMLVMPTIMERIRQYPMTWIDDKSKADQVAKLLTCFQARWMILQCSARHFQKLPITFLELNTVLHVGNAVVMYALWWEKPLDFS
ncbi:hypothetical protein BDD12DRAFT_431533 [Trichophaea hybrida]|nr:hypothetical protein BDD12DRAFT_431533 [Trichophaea hybrida]